MPKYYLHTLGAFEVAESGEAVALPRSRKARGLLAYLAVERRVQSKDHLVELFFAETRDPKGGLRWAISRLRAALDRDFIVSSGSSISLDSDRHEVDVEQLELPLPPSISIDELIRLEGVIQGDFLADLSLAKIAEYEAWRLANQVNCNEHHTTLLENIISKSLGTVYGVDSARKLVNLDVTRESAWALLVKSLLSMNQLSDARHVQRLAVEQLERDRIRLTGKLEEVWRSQRGEHIEAGNPSAATTTQIALKPRVAILHCPATKSSDAGLADRITQIVIRACSACKLVTVLAPRISEQLGEIDSHLPSVSDELGIDLILRPSIDGHDNGNRIEVELIDARTGGSMFRWNRAAADTGSHTDSRAFEAYFSARVEIDLPIALVQRVREKELDQLSAHDQYLLALPRMFSAEGFDPVEAHELLESALSRRPYFGQACCALSLIRMFMPHCNDNEEQLEITLSLARRAVEISQDDAFVLGLAAATISHVSGDTDTGVDLSRRALSINPFSVMAGISAAMVHHYHGDDDACFMYIDAVEANSDTDPVSFFCFTCRAMAHYQCKEYAAALTWSKKAVGHNPTFVIALRYLLASLAQLGEIEKATELAHKMHAIDSSENIAFFRRRSAYRNQRRTEHLCDGLRMGGLPETA